MFSVNCMAWRKRATEIWAQLSRSSLGGCRISKGARRVYSSAVRAPKATLKAGRLDDKACPQSWAVATQILSPEDQLEGIVISPVGPYSKGVLFS